MTIEEELYELCRYKEGTGESLVSEMGWINDNSFCIWINYYDIEEFMKQLILLFSHGVFDDGSFNCNMQSFGICIDLCKALGDDINLEEVFPKEQFQH